MDILCRFVSPQTILNSGAKAAIELAINRLILATIQRLSIPISQHREESGGNRYTKGVITVKFFCI